MIPRLGDGNEDDIDIDIKYSLENDSPFRGRKLKRATLIALTTSQFRKWFPV